MEGDTFNTTQAETTQAPITPATLPKLSFIPNELVRQYEGPLGVREKCAYAGVVVGCIAVASWVIILLGLIVSIVGISLSLAGLKSKRSKQARVGVVLSAIGLIGALLYAVAAYQGIINYVVFY